MLRESNISVCQGTTLCQPHICTKSIENRACPNLNNNRKIKIRKKKLKKLGETFDQTYVNYV